MARSRKRTIRQIRPHHQLHGIGIALRVIASGLIAMSVTGCGESELHIKSLEPDAVVLAFGDSLTSGKGAADEETYPATLSRLTGYTVVNAGKSGEISAAGLERLPSLLALHNPDLVILCHGGNDMLRKLGRDETIANVSAMIAMIKTAGADVILLGVPEPGIFLKTASFYSELALEHGIPYDVKTISQVLNDASSKSDYIHPNAKGYRTMAESVAKLIQTSQPS